MEEKKPRNPNLRDISLTHEKAVEIGRRGGLASGKARQRRKQLRTQLSEILAAKPVESELLAALDAAGLDATHEAAMCLAVMARAEAGDIEAARFIRDTIGEKPSEKLSLISDYQGRIDELDLSQLTDEELIALADGDDW